MGTKTPYGLTSTGQRSTAYSSGMLSGLTNRYNSIGDAGGIMADSSPSVDTWDGIGRDPSLKTPAELAEEARERAKAGGGYNIGSNNTLQDVYDAFAEASGGDASTAAVLQAQGFDYLNSMAQSQSAASANSSPFDLINGNTPAALTPAELAAQGAANLAAAAARKVTPLTDEQLYQQNQDFYGGLINRFDPRNSRGYGEIPEYLGQEFTEASIAAETAAVAADAAAAYAASPEGIAAQELADQQAASQAAIDAAAVTQQQDDAFQTAVNAAGGVNVGTLGAVIDAAQDSFGGNTSRAIVTVITESLKAGITMDDLAAETKLSSEAIMNAVKTAGADPDASLTTAELINGGINTVYDVVNTAIDLVEKGLEITGIEKLINAAGNTVAKIIGLDPTQAQKVLVVNPVTGQISVQATNQTGGGLGNYLPKSAYVPVGTTAGGTAYGVDTGNAIVNVLLGKIRTNGGLEGSDARGILGAAIEEVTGINASVVGGLVNATGDVIKVAQDVINTIGGGDDNSGTTATLAVVGGDAATGNVLGPIDTRTNAEKEAAATATALSLTPNSDNLITAINNSACPNAGEIRNANGDCYNPTTDNFTCPDTYVNAKQVVSDISQCGGLKTTTTTDNFTCPDTYVNAKQVVSDISQCGGLKTTTTTDSFTCPDTYVNAKQVVSDISQCGGLKITTTTVDTTDRTEVVCTDPEAVYDATDQKCYKGTVTTLGTTDRTETVCSEEGAVYDLETNKCYKGTVTTLGTTDRTETVCSEEGAVYDATDGKCYKGTVTTLGTTDRSEVLCSEEGAVYDSTDNKCYKGSSRTVDTVDRTEVLCSNPEGVYDLETDKCYIGGPRTVDTECPGGIYDATTDSCAYTDLSCATLGLILGPLGYCIDPPVVVEEDPGTIVPPTTLGLPPRFVEENDVLVEDPGAFQTPYSILPAPVSDPYLADRRSQDILNVASTVGIQPGAGLDQTQEAVDRFAGYANTFDVGLPELEAITGATPAESLAYEDKFDVSFPVTGTAPPVTPALPIAGERYVPTLPATPVEATPVEEDGYGNGMIYIDPVTGLPTHTNPNPGSVNPLLPSGFSTFAEGGVVENGDGIESLLDRRQQAVNRMLIKRARGMM